MNVSVNCFNISGFRKRAKNLSSNGEVSTPSVIPERHIAPISNQIGKPCPTQLSTLTQTSPDKGASIEMFYVIILMIKNLSPKHVFTRGFKTPCWVHNERKIFFVQPQECPVHLDRLVYKLSSRLLSASCSQSNQIPRENLCCFCQ